MPADSEAIKPAGPTVPRNWIITACLVIITICIGGQALAYMRDILTPLLIAIFLYFLIQPLVELLFTWKLPRWMLYTLLVLIPMVGLLLVSWIVNINVREFTERLPDYRKRLTAMVETGATKLGYTDEKGNFDWEAYSLSDVLDFSQKEIIENVLDPTMKVVEVTVLVVFYLLFLFIEARKFRGRVQSGFEPETASRVLGVMNKVDQSVRQYLWIKTGVSIGLGISTSILCLLFGLDFWLLWGMLAFLANYITYVGSIAALVPPIAIAFLQYDSLLTAGLLSGLLVANRTFWIDWAEIRYSGEHLDVSPLLLLLSIALLGWIWGVVGMLLAVPLVTSTKIVLMHFENTRSIARLMSDN